MSSTATTTWTPTDTAPWSPSDCTNAATATWRMSTAEAEDAARTLTNEASAAATATWRMPAPAPNPSSAQPEDPTCHFSTLAKAVDRFAPSRYSLLRLQEQTPGDRDAVLEHFLAHVEAHLASRYPEEQGYTHEAASREAGDPRIEFRVRKGLDWGVRVTFQPDCHGGGGTQHVKVAVTEGSGRTPWLQNLLFGIAGLITVTLTLLMTLGGVEAHHEVLGTALAVFLAPLVFLIQVPLVVGAMQVVHYVQQNRHRADLEELVRLVDAAWRRTPRQRSELVRRENPVFEQLGMFVLFFVCAAGSMVGAAIFEPLVMVSLTCASTAVVRGMSALASLCGNLEGYGVTCRRPALSVSERAAERFVAATSAQRG